MVKSITSSDVVVVSVRLMVQREQIILVPKSLLAPKGFPAKKCLP